MLLTLLFYANVILAQDEKITNAGIIHFEASVPLFEEVKATNNKVSLILSTKTGAIVCIVLIKDFRFKIPMMEKHFNDYYMESDYYPKASFKGIIQGFNWNIIGTSPKEFKLKGTLKMHGKTKKISTVAILRKVDGGLEILSVFDVNSKDFNIKIPEMLNMKVAETVNVKTLFFVK
ncbi:MAG TPA: YceI family protein [Flavobacterium sp.]|nr:YceI family protein [Flavobacterium sp.]